MELKDIIKDNSCSFFEANKGILYYKTLVNGKDYFFPINMNNKEDVGEGWFKATEKSIYLMRWIRNALKNGTFKEVIH